MPAKGVTMSENSRCAYQGNLNHWIYPALGDLKMPDITSANIAALENEPLKWRVLMRLLIDTGIRRGECCGLQWKDINFRESTITISGNLCYTPQRGIYLDTPKSGKVRTIDIDPEIISLLCELRQEQASQIFREALKKTGQK